jgi:hypothetical protein
MTGNGKSASIWVGLIAGLGSRSSGVSAPDAYLPVATYVDGGGRGRRAEPVVLRRTGRVGGLKRPSGYRILDELAIWA